MKRKLLFTAALAVFALTINAQDLRTGKQRCYSVEHEQWLQSQNPNLKVQKDNDEQKLQSWLQNFAAARVSNGNSTNSVIVIPVVVHVVYKLAGQNI